MTEPIHAMAIDLSHWDPAQDYKAVKKDGIVGVVYKATEGSGYQDPTYVEQQKAAKAAGLCWGAYHFANGENVKGQVDNFLNFASPDPNELFCLDWEDNPSGTKMSLSQAKEWISQVETVLGRPGECVIYGGNTIKEALGNKADPFFGSRRLWLCQYSSTPVIQVSWKTYWLWQFTDGVSGPVPHSISGVGPCDINSYQSGDAAKLAAEWASGTAQPMPVPPEPEPEAAAVYLNLTTTGPVSVNIAINGEVIYGNELA